MMKNSFLFILCSLIYFTAYSKMKIVEVTHYLFPEFTKGVVLMNSGEKHETLLNYNCLTEEMIFDNKGTKLALADLDQVDTAYVAGRKFFLLNNKWVELLLNSKYGLYAENKCTLKDTGTPTGYGGTSQVSSSDSFSSYISEGQVYELHLPERFKTIPYIKYWLEKEGELSEFLNLRQLEKLFPEKSDLMKQYVKKKGVKYDNRASVVDLIKYLAAN